METSNNAAGDDTRRLVEGERVEVLQKERGLRGSWHSGVVVKVKHGRRVVEYDELFTLDGSKKLRESIPLCSGETKLQTSTRRDTILDDSRTSSIAASKKNVSTDSSKRGFIRPIPPPCPAPSRKNWRRGLLVDTFYNDAWWEGILLNDVVSDCEEFEVKVFFPEEGDELEVSLKLLRVSQEWDEASNLWAVRGYWGSEGGMDLAALKEISIKTKCPLKALWRQKRFFSLEDVFMQEQRIWSQNEAECRHRKEPSNMHTVSKALNMLEFSIPDQCITPKRNRDHCHLSTPLKGDGMCPTMKLNSSQKIEFVETTPLCSDHDFKDSNTELIREISDSVNLADHKFLSSGNTCRKLKSGSLMHQSVKFTKSKSPSTNMFSGKGLGRKRNGKLIDLRISGDGHDPCMQTENSLNSSAIYDALSLDENDPKDNDAVSSEIQSPSKAPTCRAQLSAKNRLVSAGWKIESHLFHRDSAEKCKTQYIAPDGSRFLSLGSACRRLRADKEVHSSLVVETNRVLAAHKLSEGIVVTPASTEKVSKNDELMKEICSSNFQEMAGFGSHSKLTRCPERTTLPLEKSKKRLTEGCTELLPVEPKRKRGRPSHNASRLLPENKVAGVKGSCRMQVLLSIPEKGQNASLDIGVPTQFKKSTVFSWLMDKGILKENEPVCYVNKKDGHVMKQGKVTREGVMCDCCKDIFTLSNFETHAGSKLHRPSANTFLDDGRSISDCQLEACALQDTKEKEGIIDVSDDACSVCGDGGELVLCDHCPSAFHVDCIGLMTIPEGDWYCPRCSCGSCGVNQHINKLDSRMLRCVQCELEYHASCVAGCSLLPSNQAAQKSWFCDDKCRKIFLDLRRLVGLMHSLENGFSWMLLRSMKRGHALSRSSLEVMAEHHSKLSVAHGVMQECFVPMIDPRTKINLISQALYNRRSKVARLNYCGFYTIILERGDEIISVATLRVHGPKLAEVPLVGTRYQYRRQGMCRRLMHALEEMLKSVGVEKLILPAVPELLETWTCAFGFQKMSLTEIQKSSKSNLMTFPGTTLLQKSLFDVSHLHGEFHDANVTGTLKNPCDSIEAILNMTPASLDGFLDGSINNDISPKDIMMFSYIQDVLSDDQDIREAFMTPKFVKPKNRIRHKIDVVTESSVTDGKQQDDDTYTKVVIGTTRSKRLIKSRRWVADGLRELMDSRLPRRNSVTEDMSTNMPTSVICEIQKSKLGNTDAQIFKQDIIAQDTSVQNMGQIVKNVYIRTRRKPLLVSQDSMNASVLKLRHTESGENNSFCRKDDSEFGAYLQLHSGEVVDGLQFCPKFYIRRKKRDDAQENLKVKDGSGCVPSKTMIDHISSDFVAGSVQSNQSKCEKMQTVTNDCSVKNELEMLSGDCNAVAVKEDMLTCNSDVASNMLTDGCHVISDYVDGTGGNAGILTGSLSHGDNVIDCTSATMIDHNADSSLERLGSTVVCNYHKEVTNNNSSVLSGKVVSINDSSGTSRLLTDDCGDRDDQVERGEPSSVVGNFNLMAGDAGTAPEDFSVIGNASSSIQRLGSSNFKKLAV